MTTMHTMPKRIWRRFVAVVRGWICIAKKLSRRQLHIHFQLAWRLGDEISSIPIYEAAKTAYPNSRISVAVNFPELLFGNPHVDAINPVGSFPDIVYDIRRTNPRMYRYDYLSGIVPFPIVNRQPRLYGMRLTQDPVIDAWIRDHAHQVKLCVCPESSWSCKNWPVDRYRFVCARLMQEHRVAIVQVGLAEKMDIAGLDLVGKTTDIHRLIYLMSKVDMFFGNDTALLHLALAMNKVSVGIFGPVIPGTVIAPRKECISVQKTDIPCIGCWSRGLMTQPGTCLYSQPYCMTTLPVETVYTMVDEARLSLNIQ